MTRLSLVLVSLGLTVASGCAGEADWTLTEHAPSRRGGNAEGTRVGTWALVDQGLPGNARVRSIAHLDGSVFAIVEPTAGATSVYALHRDATSWVLAQPARRSASEQFSALAVLDRALYLTTADEAQQRGSLFVLRFSDEPWSRIEGAPDLPMSALARKNGRIVVAAHGASSTAGLYGSSDSGETWIQLTSPTKDAAFFSRPVRTFAASPAAQRMFATGDLASGFGGLYASDDGGFSWTQLPVRGDVIDVRASAEFVLLCSTAEGELRSDNYGNTFRPVDVGARAQAFFVSGSRAFAATSSGVRVSEDGGATWSDASSGLPSFVQVESLYLAGGSLIAAAPGDVFIAQLE